MHTTIQLYLLRRAIVHFRGVHIPAGVVVYKHDPRGVLVAQERRKFLRFEIDVEKRLGGKLFTAIYTAFAVQKIDIQDLVRKIPVRRFHVRAKTFRLKDFGKGTRFGHCVALRKFPQASEIRGDIRPDSLYLGKPFITRLQDRLDGAELGEKLMRQTVGVATGQGVEKEYFQILVIAQRAAVHFFYQSLSMPCVLVFWRCFFAYFRHSRKPFYFFVFIVAHFYKNVKVLR